ncbi:MAG: SRPBCC domain-containing protein [Gemmataceae bacterium]
MLRFEGDREFDRPLPEVADKLTDVAFLVSCLPDVESVRSMDTTQADLVLRPGFQFVRGALDMTMHLVERSTTAARLRFLARGIGSSSEVEAQLALGEREGKTVVHWNAEVKSLGGLLKLVPAGLIRGAAEAIIQNAWERVADRLR